MAIPITTMADLIQRVESAGLEGLIILVKHPTWLGNGLTEAYVRSEASYSIDNSPKVRTSGMTLNLAFIIEEGCFDPSSGWEFSIPEDNDPV